MNSREMKKKQWEVWQGALVARAINQAEGTDYEASPATQEPADVVLKSISGKYPDIEAQVVSIPLDFRSRNDKHTLIQLETYLRQILLDRGMHHMFIGVIPSGEVEMHGVPRHIIDRLADLIEREGRNREVYLSNDDIYDCDHELGEMFHSINISHHPDVIKDVKIDIPQGCAVPPDGWWIEEGIRKKFVKYGGYDAVKNLALIIGVAGIVDDRQIAAFRTTFAESELPFAEIWINTQFHGTSCLKNRIEFVH